MWNCEMDDNELCNIKMDNNGAKFVVVGEKGVGNGRFVRCTDAISSGTRLMMHEHIWWWWWWWWCCRWTGVDWVSSGHGSQALSSPGLCPVSQVPGLSVSVSELWSTIVSPVSILWPSSPHTSLTRVSSTDQTWSSLPSQHSNTSKVITSRGHNS